MSKKFCINGWLKIWYEDGVKANPLILKYYPGSSSPGFTAQVAWCHIKTAMLSWNMPGDYSVNGAAATHLQ